MNENTSESKKPNQDNLRTVYEELCTSYHRIADFRAKLLGFLPLASGAGILLVLDKLPPAETQQSTIMSAASVFGLLITLGLFSYELRGIQRCNGLIEAGRGLEDELSIRGQFRLRPENVEGRIGSTLAGQIIYSAVLAAWSFVALTGTSLSCAVLVALLVFLASVGISSRLDLKPKLSNLLAKDQQEQDRRIQQR